MIEADASPSSSESPPRPDTDGKKGEPPADQDAAKSEAEVDPDDEVQLPLGLNQTAGRDMFVGSTIFALNNTSSKGADRAIVSWWPLLDEFAEPPPSFVKPANFDFVLGHIRKEHAAVLVGAECGCVTVAAVALRVAGHDPIVELPAISTTSELLTAITQVCRANPRAGVVIPSLGEEAIRGFGAAEVRRLRGSLGRAAAILVTRDTASLDPSQYALQTIDALAPDAREIVQAYAADDQNLSGRAQRAVEALSQAGPVGPGMAVALVQAARVHKSAGPDELVGLLSGRSEAMDEWLASGPTARQVASLAAAITLAEVPTVDVDHQAAQLQWLLDDGGEKAEAEAKRFGLADRGWPAGIVEITRTPIASYFGMQEAEIVQICSPHRREDLFSCLWDRLGSEFRSPFIQWLRSLAEHASPRVRSGAAVTAGVLFAKEPITAERELLRPWALDGRRFLCECAGLAIGIPIVLNVDPSASRALAYTWSLRQSGAKRVRASIAAYGGPLGSWDLGCSAPAQLWRIADDAAGSTGGDRNERRAVIHDADSRLAALTTGGTSTSQIREAVIGLLSAQVESQEVEDRIHAFRILPILVRRITRRDNLARASLAALLTEPERASLQMLTRLLARSLDTPAGAEYGQATIVALLESLGAGWIDQEVVSEFIRGMKAGAQPGRRAALGEQLERVLSVERRSDSNRGRAAAGVYAAFFS